MARSKVESDDGLLDSVVDGTARRGGDPVADVLAEWRDSVDSELIAD